VCGYLVLLLRDLPVHEGAPGLLVVWRDAGLVLVQASTVLEVLAAEIARHQPVGGRDRLVSS
jgi:hypothetical protein